MKWSISTDQCFVSTFSPRTKIAPMDDPGILRAGHRQPPTALSQSCCPRETMNEMRVDMNQPRDVDAWTRVRAATAGRPEQFGRRGHYSFRLVKGSCVRRSVDAPKASARLPRPSPRSPRPSSRLPTVSARPPKLPHRPPKGPRRSPKPSHCPPKGPRRPPTSSHRPLTRPRRPPKPSHCLPRRRRRSPKPSHWPPM